MYSILRLMLLEISINLILSGCGIIKHNQKNRPTNNFMPADMIISSSRSIQLADEAENTESILPSIEDFAIQQDSGYVFIITPESELMKIDRMGTIIFKKRVYGQGPGEITIPTMLRYRNNKVYILDSGAQKVAVYDNHGCWKADIKYNNCAIESFDVDWNENLIIPNTIQLNAADEPLFLVISPEGNKINQISQNKHIKEDFVSSFPRPVIYITPDSCLVLVFRIHGSFYKFNMNGDLLFTADIKGGQEWNDSVKAEMDEYNKTKLKFFQWRLNYMYFRLDGSIFAAWGGNFKDQVTLCMIYNSKGFFVGRLFQSEAFPYLPQRIALLNDSTFWIYSETANQLAECAIRNINQEND